MYTIEKLIAKPCQCTMSYPGHHGANLLDSLTTLGGLSGGGKGKISLLDDTICISCILWVLKIYKVVTIVSS